MRTEELKLIVGGASISGTVLNAAIRIVNAALEAGRAMGTAIRRIKYGQLCKLK